MFQHVVFSLFFWIFYFFIVFFCDEKDLIVSIILYYYYCSCLNCKLPCLVSIEMLNTKILWIFFILFWIIFKVVANDRGCLFNFKLPVSLCYIKASLSCK